MNLRETLKQHKWKLFLRRYKRVFLTSLLLVVVTGVVINLTIIAKPFITLALDNGITPGFVWTFITTRTLPLRQTDERTNILVLGTPGGNHEGPDLTDAMMIVSIHHQEASKSAFIALPRDTWSPSLKDKINSAYHYGEGKRKGGGLVLAESIAGEVSGLTLHYAFLIDFSQFTKIIDALGGVEVMVDTTLDDTDFPIAGKENDFCNGDPTYRCRYKHIRFEQGKQFMNGEQALEFVRSRHASDEEGTDYARSRRQQAVIVSIKEKVMTKEILTDPQKLSLLLRLFDTATDTNLFLSDLLYLGRYVRKHDLHDFRRIVIPAEGRTREAGDLLIVAPPLLYENRWVLIPKTESFEAIHDYIRCQFKGESCR